MRQHKVLTACCFHIFKVVSYIDIVVPAFLAVEHADLEQNTETMNVHA
jgi:hypothetical protein